MKQCYTIITLVCLFSSIPTTSILTQVFWSENFSEGIPNNWVNENLITGPALWFHCNTPESCPPNIYGPDNDDLEFGIFQSPTANNGYAYYDSFSWINEHKGILQTPNIDISGQEKVFVEFYTHIATFNKNPEANALLKVITPEDTIAIKVFPGLWTAEIASVNAYRVNIELSAFLEGVNTISLQWYWSGIQEFSWSIDDIVLSSEDPSLPPNTCWSERFAFGMEGWTTINPVEPNAIWEWVEGGDISPAIFAIPGTVIHSPSGVDGAMVFNAEFLTSGGVQSQLQNDPLHYYRCDLISPIIDIPCIGKPLELQFSQLIKKGNVAPNAPQSSQNSPLITSISWSFDDGDNWSSPIDASPTSSPNFSFGDPIDQIRTSIPLPFQLDGSEELRLRFTWAGDLFFWAIDDIILTERPSYDMKVNRNFFAIMPNAVTPFGQAGNVAFLADLTNIGCQEATGVVLDLDIAHTATGQSVFSDQLNFSNVQSDELVENILFENQLFDEQLYRTGSYKGKYMVTQDSTDERPENNVISWEFEISDSTFAKELGPTRNITSSESLNFTYGNCFFVPKGTGKFARWITVGIANTLALADSNAEINIFLYKWKDMNNNDLAEPDEYEFAEEGRGVNSYPFNSLQDDQGFITLPVHFEGGGIALQDSSHYIVAVEYISSSGIPCDFLASDQFNYQATTFVSDSLNQNRYSSALDVNNTGTFNFIGFGLDIVPVVRLHIGETPDLSIPGIISSVASLNLDRQLNIFPNPNRGNFSFDLKLDYLSRYVGVEVINMSGSILISKKFENIKEKQFNLNLSTITPGSYLLKIQTDQGILTKLFIVQH